MSTHRQPQGAPFEFAAETLEIFKVNLCFPGPVLTEGLSSWLDLKLEH